MSLTSDPTDPRLTHGADERPTAQADAYLVLPATAGRPRVRPVRHAYVHNGSDAAGEPVSCGGVTSMNEQIAETYAVDPTFYGATYCWRCKMHRPVGEFTWLSDGETVGS